MEVKRSSDSWRNVFRHRKLLSGSGNNMRRRQKIFRAIDRIGVDIPGDDSPHPPPRQFGLQARM